MPRLTAQQARRLERELAAQRRVALGQAHDEVVRASEQSYFAIAGEVPDFGDQATATTLTDFDNEIARRHAGALREIDDALLRIGSHQAGRCVDCDSDIAFERLLAFPTARRCLSCQSLHERTYAVGATPTL
jgi:DnaK suppressor protein